MSNNIVKCFKLNLVGPSNVRLGKGLVQKFSQNPVFVCDGNTSRRRGLGYIVVRIRHSLKMFVATNDNPGMLAASPVLYAKLSWLPLRWLSIRHENHITCNSFLLPFWLVVIIRNTVLCCVKLVKLRIDSGQYSENIKVLLVECIVLGLSVYQTEIHFIAVLELLAPPLLSAPLSCWWCHLMLATQMLHKHIFTFTFSRLSLCFRYQLVCLFTKIFCQRYG